MTHEDPKLFLFSTEPGLLTELRSRFPADGNITVALGNGPDVSKRFMLDALWLTPMQSSYFGVAPPLPPHVAKVFPMPDDRRKQGFPRLIIAGVALVPGRIYTKHYLDGLGASAMTEAVLAYNETHETPILRIGANPGSLGLDDLANTALYQSLREAFTWPQLHQPVTLSSEFSIRA